MKLLVASLGFVMTSLADVIESLGSQRAGLALLAAVAVGSAGAGALVHGTFNVAAQVPARIDSLESSHDTLDLELNVAQRRLREMEVRMTEMDPTLERIEAMVNRMFCDQYPSECEPQPNGGQ